MLGYVCMIDVITIPGAVIMSIYFDIIHVMLLIIEIYCLNVIDFMF